MGKQTMGVPLHALNHRSDNKLYRLQTAQSPLVRPYLHDDLDMDNYPLGTNAIVAVLSYTVGFLHKALSTLRNKWFYRAFTSFSRMHVMNHNWSATKRHLHPQSVAEISRHSVLSGDRILQCETSSGSRHKNADQCL